MRNGLPLPFWDPFYLHNSFLLGLPLVVAIRNTHSKRLRLCVPLSNVHALSIGDLECHALRYCLPLTIYNFVGVRYCNLDAFGNAFIACIANGKWLLICVQLLVLLTVALCDEQRLRNGNIFGQPNVVAECVTHAQWMLICVPLFVCFALALRDG